MTYGIYTDSQCRIAALVPVVTSITSPGTLPRGPPVVLGVGTYYWKVDFNSEGARIRIEPLVLHRLRDRRSTERHRGLAASNDDHGLTDRCWSMGAVIDGARRALPSPRRPPASRGPCAAHRDRVGQVQPVQREKFELRGVVTSDELTAPSVFPPLLRWRAERGAGWP